MTTAEEMIEKVAAILMGRINAPEAEIYAAARAACAVAVEMCAEVAFNEQTRQLHEECGHTDEYFDGRSDVHSHLCIIATAIKGE